MGVTALIENDAELDRKNSDGETPFEQAAAAGAPEASLGENASLIPFKDAGVQTMISSSI